MPSLEITELVVILLILPFALLGAILPVIAFWKICTRVGLNGTLGLLMLVPIANLVLPMYVVFTSWPGIKRESGQIAEIE